MSFTALAGQPYLTHDEAISLAAPHRRLDFESALPLSVEHSESLKMECRQARLTGLAGQLESLASLLPNFDELANSYVHQTDTSVSADRDADAMLAWLSAAQELPPLSQDLVELQRARRIIERRGRQQQPTARRAQTLYDLNRGTCRPLPGPARRARLHLNPLRAWCRLRTSRFLVGDVTPPATILLFAVADVFSARVFELEGQALINELADYQPCTLDQWSSLSALATRDQLASFCQDLSGSGLISYSTNHPAPDAN